MWGCNQKFSLVGQPLGDIQAATWTLTECSGKISNLSFRIEAPDLPDSTRQHVDFHNQIVGRRPVLFQSWSVGECRPCTMPSDLPGCYRRWQRNISHTTRSSFTRYIWPGLRYIYSLLALAAIQLSREHRTTIYPSRPSSSA